MMVSRWSTDDDTLILAESLLETPLRLEEPGKITEALTEFVGDERLERMLAVLGRRTRHVTALVEHVQNPGNVAACIRSCDAFGIQDLHMVTEAGQPIRVARGIGRGTHRWLTVHHHANLDSALAELRREGYRVLATDPGSSERQAIAVEEIELSERVCIAFGNERDGISDALRESFNISVAFALVMSSLRRRRDQVLGADGDLSSVERARVLDRWMLAQVPQGTKVLEELVRRQKANDH
jgi:tRNA (guanosine-2'-O-)-methyltransferase